MAQRTGDKRLLTLPAKSTSAGLCLALVLAGLSLGGCGGGSSDPVGTTGSEKSSTGAAVADSGSSESPVGEHPSRARGDSNRSTREGQTQPSAGSPPAQGQKHGPEIVQPKGPPEQAPTPTEIAKATVVDMTLSSPSLPAGPGGPAPLSAAYTCDGKGDWPALGWSGVPGGTAELILYTMNIAPVGGKLFVDWALAGIDPALTGIEAGKLPKGTVVGTNSFGKQGYEICPEGSETYIFALYALPRSLSPRPGFDPRELRQQILDASGNAGVFPVSYTRG